MRRCQRYSEASATQNLKGLSLISYPEFHYGAAFGPPFDVSTDCTDINLISPELLLNWGNANGHDGTLGTRSLDILQYVLWLRLLRCLR